jgi:hypothetical protein
MHMASLFQLAKNIRLASKSFVNKLETCSPWVIAAIRSMWWFLLLCVTIMEQYTCTESQVSHEPPQVQHYKNLPKSVQNWLQNLFSNSRLAMPNGLLNLVGRYAKLLNWVCKKKQNKDQTLVFFPRALARWCSLGSHRSYTVNAAVLGLEANYQCLDGIAVSAHLQLCLYNYYHYVITIIQ